MQKAESFDAIVIGSGMGGLAAASLLARVGGKRVLVLILAHHARQSPKRNAVGAGSGAGARMR